MVDELALLQNKHEEEKAVWKKENEELVAEKKCLSSWKRSSSKTFNSGVTVDDPHYDVNKDVSEGQLLDEEEMEATNGIPLAKGQSQEA
ncbi:hypothetical protein DEO72_LG10g2162 [Vigna unguiculata]|uniref:Uncharacterized protein n=1 Tax=Vigna unguiculata TaxID=3917 RepID=A0A4D6NEE1_VIGUN|nr:hypothetical protein DEO72_LG10g2162 [Vigna unguiculata]